MSEQKQKNDAIPKSWQTFASTAEKYQLSPTDTVKAPDAFTETAYVEKNEALPKINYVSSIVKKNDKKAEKILSTSTISEFDLGELLAVGGMGQICTATQLPLRREVAIKMLRSDKRTEQMETRLQQEARLTGVLEHPNIIPIYQLGQNENGHTMLVMKRIEGSTWSDILQKKNHASEEISSEEQTLEAQIRILIRVCDAIEFAHSKQIIHRDLKPENIMVGRFGEVYVLDWGIALDLKNIQEKPPSTQTNTHSLSGTPAYMAPEMLKGDSKHLDERTDIYLLGSILHELLVGAPPHKGGNILQLLSAIARRTSYSYPSSVPEGLAEICNRAMHPQKEKRFQNIKAFRKALEKSFVNRESYKLGREAYKMMNELQEHLTFISPNAHSLPPMYTPPEDLEPEIYSLFWRCHFGFKQALRIWKDNQRAQEGLQKLLEIMVRHELGQKDTKAAAALLSELPIPNPILEQELEVLYQNHARKAEDIKELKQLKFDRDARVGAQTRKFAVLLGGLLYAVASFLVYFLGTFGLYQADHAGFLLNHTLGIFFVGLGSYFGRKALLGNKINRQVVMIFALMSSVLLLTRIAYIQLEISVFHGSCLDLFILFTILGNLAIFHDVRLFIGATGYLLAFAMAVGSPQLFFVFLGFAHILSTLNIVLIWKVK